MFCYVECYCAACCLAYYRAACCGEASDASCRGKACYRAVCCFAVLVCYSAACYVEAFSGVASHSVAGVAQPGVVPLDGGGGMK